MPQPRNKVAHPRFYQAASTPYWEPYIAVDLDGTLAEAIPGNDYSDPTLIGPPVAAMVEKVKRAIEVGATVKVFTARMADKENAERIAEAIGDYTEEHVGTRLEATNEKDPGCIYILDDKARQVIPDTGEVVIKTAAVEGERIMNDCHGFVSGETRCTVSAYNAAGDVTGYVDYGLYDEEIHIKYIEVGDAHQRQGIATRLLEWLRQNNPGYSIRWGMLTPDGAALKTRVHKPADERNRILEELERSRPEFVKRAQDTYDTYPVPEFGNLQGDGGLAENIADDLEWSVAHETSGWGQIRLEGNDYVLHCHDTRGGLATMRLPSSLFQEQVDGQWRKKEGVTITPEQIIIAAPVSRIAANDSECTKEWKRLPEATDAQRTLKAILLTAGNDKNTTLSRFGGIPETIAEEYSYGKCMWLALALHRKLGWPMRAAIDGDGYIDHAWVVAPDGRELDIVGYDGPGDFKHAGVRILDLSEAELLDLTHGLNAEKLAEAEQVADKYVIPNFVKTAGNDKNTPGKAEQGTEYPEYSNGWALNPDQGEGETTNIPLEKLIPQV